MSRGRGVPSLRAEMLEQYRRNTNDSFRLYTDEAHRINEEADEYPV
jgi:hypothetical protein